MSHHFSHILSKEPHNTGGFIPFLQVDITPTGGNHKKVGDWNSLEHLRQGTGILVDFIGRISKKFPSWTAEQKLKGLFTPSLHPVSFSFVVQLISAVAVRQQWRSQTDLLTVSSLRQPVTGLRSTLLDDLDRLVFLLLLV